MSELFELASPVSIAATDNNNGQAFNRHSMSISSGSTTTEDEQSQSPFVAEAIVQSLIRLPDSQSSAILAALRLGVPPQSIVDDLLLDNDHISVLLEQRTASILLPTTQNVNGLHNLVHRQEKAFWSPWTFDRMIWHQVVFEVPAFRQVDRLDASLSVEAWQNHASLDERVSLPLWAVLPRHNPGNQGDPFDHALERLRLESANVDLEKYCGSHAHIGALLDVKQFHAAPRLSQVVAMMTRSILPDAEAMSFTAAAIMYTHWHIWAWLLHPTQQTYDRIPDGMRPTPWQLLASHPLVYDFFPTSELRDRLCKSPLASNHWIVEACKTARCHWPGTLLTALCLNKTTKALDFTKACKTHLARSDIWSLGASVRPYFPDVDRCIEINTMMTD